MKLIFIFMTSIHYFYKITNLVNGKYYYGVHNTNKLDDGYMGSGVILKKAQEKYGIENFKKEILKYFDTSDDAFTYEHEVVNESVLNDPNTYNVKYGGSGWQNEHMKTGMVVVTDGTNAFMVNKNDERYLSGELAEVHKGMATLRDSDGNTYYVSKDDPRRKSGELFGACKGVRKTDEYRKNMSEVMRRAMKEHPERFAYTCGKRDCIWMYRLDESSNRYENIHVTTADIEAKLSEGWAKGRKLGEYMNDGKHMKMVQPCDIEYYLNNGWKKGTIKAVSLKSRNAGTANPNYGKVYVWREADNSAGFETMSIPKSKLDEYVLDGWKKGRRIGKRDMTKYFKSKGYPTAEQLHETYERFGSWNDVAEFYGITRKITQLIRKHAEAQTNENV